MKPFMLKWWKTVGITVAGAAISAFGYAGTNIFTLAGLKAAGIGAAAAGLSTFLGALLQSPFSPQQQPDDGPVWPPQPPVARQ